MLEVAPEPYVGKRTFAGASEYWAEVAYRDITSDGFFAHYFPGTRYITDSVEPLVAQFK
jgi:hypothetical protein